MTSSVFVFVLFLSLLAVPTLSNPVLQPRLTPYTPTPTPCGTICIDAQKDCTTTTIPYGGCFPFCPNSPFPTPTAPVCPNAVAARNEATTATTTTTFEPCPTVCIDGIKPCASTTLGFGGCFTSCPGQPFPTPTQPACPEECPEVCIDKVKVCPDGRSIKYGGCVRVCPGQPDGIPEPECH